MTIELDHLFICTTKGALEAAELLQMIGLVEGSAAVHPGQGTANRRFFFHNFMLELLWVEDPSETRSDPVRTTYLWDRWVRRHEVCPFGLGFRAQEAKDSGILPFETWEYHPPYLPPPLSILVGMNSSQLMEPMLFYLSFGSRPDKRVGYNQEPLKHTTGWQELTQLTVVMPHAFPLSPELQALVNSGFIQVQPGLEYRVELGFDGEERRQSYDCRPTLPLIIHG